MPKNLISINFGMDYIDEIINNKFFDNSTNPPILLKLSENNLW